MRNKRWDDENKKNNRGGKNKIMCWKKREEGRGKEENRKTRKREVGKGRE